MELDIKLDRKTFPLGSSICHEKIWHFFFNSFVELRKSALLNCGTKILANKQLLWQQKLFLSNKL